MRPRFAPPLRPGDVIGVTAPSAGVGDELATRLDVCVRFLRQRGYQVEVGACMRADAWVSAPKDQRAAELTRMLTDPSIRAVVPPWGGAGTALDLLDRLDYDAIAEAEPTWLVGYSDLSTLMVPLTLRAGLATLHGDNLMDTPYAAPAGLAHWLDIASSTGPVTQRSPGLIADWHFDDPHAAEWKQTGRGDWTLVGADSLDVTGTLIGGCIEMMAGIAGTPYGDVRGFGAEHGALVVYLEASDAEAFDICRNLHTLRYCGWFDHAVAVLVGRTDAPDSFDDGGLTQREAVIDALGGLGVPVVLDLEIGHVPPHLPLLNGATARVVVDGDRREVAQTWPPA